MKRTGLALSRRLVIVKGLGVTFGTFGLAHVALAQDPAAVSGSRVAPIAKKAISGQSSFATGGYRTSPPFFRYPGGRSVPWMGGTDELLSMVVDELDL